MSNGVKQGPCQIFDPKGRLMMKITFKNDKKNGLVQEFYPKGQLRDEVTYLNDEKHGDEKSYYEDGALPMNLIMLMESSMVFPSRWNEKGILVFEGEYQYGPPPREIQ